MTIDVSEFEDAIVLNAREGVQTLKVIEVIEKLDAAKMEYLQISFINQWGENHREKFYPTKHAKKLYELACAFSDGISKKGKVTVLNTSSFVGNYFHCRLTSVEMPQGEITDSYFIREIRVSPKRKDLTKSRQFKRDRTKNVRK